MNKFDKKRLNKMWQKVDSLAKKGTLGWEEYKEYLDEIVDDEQFWIFQNLLAQKYSIRNSHNISLVDARTQKIWDIIRFNTKSDFQIDLKKLYDVNNCFQIGKKVYSATASVILGELYQESTRGLTQSQDVDSVVAVKGEEVIRYDDFTQPLLEKYKLAIEFISS